MTQKVFGKKNYSVEIRFALDRINRFLNAKFLLNHALIATFLCLYLLHNFIHFIMK